MTPNGKGWLWFVAALGMMATLVGHDVEQLKDLHDALSGSFIGGAMVHFGAVVAAFIGGKLIPTE